MNETCRPGLYPRGGLPAGAPPSEKKVYDAIADALPEGWFAWHSVRLRSEEGEDAEADFIIAAVPPAPPSSPPASVPALPSATPSTASASPARPSARPSPLPSAPGILILEVKGGAVCKKDGQWYQRDKPMPKAPRDQAVRCRVFLLSKFASRGMIAPAIGEAVIFPDQDYDAPPSQGDLEGLVLGARELPYLKELLPDVMRKAIPTRFRREPSPDWVELLHDLWCERWPGRPSLSLQARAGLAERLKLDAAQFDVLSAAGENDLVLIRGGAGTGKTILAAELAAREAKAGRRVLFLTFTEALAFELAKGFSDPLVKVSPIGRFALEHLRMKGFGRPEQPAPEFWDEVTRIAARWRLRLLWRKCAFDTVIIDEAQDFGRHEWRIALRCASSKKKRVWVFMDESQAFWEKRSIPAAFLKKCVRLDLGKPYRSPPPIQSLADAYLGRGADFDSIKRGLDDAAIGITVSERHQVHEEVGREINRLLESGFKTSDIAVISLRGRMFDQNIMHCRELGGHPIVPATDDRAPDNIVCDTFLRYKGLERLAVVVTDLLRESGKYGVRMNIALSRAVGVLRIVGAREEVEKDEILVRLLRMGSEARGAV